jgi:hypothetical protein
MPAFLRPFFICLAVITAVWLPSQPRAEQVVAELIAPGASLQLDLEERFFPDLDLPESAEIRVLQHPTHGTLSMNRSFATYIAPGDYAGLDRFAVQLGTDPESVLRMELIVGQPELIESEFYAELGRLLFVLLIVAIFLEIALTVVFKNRLFEQLDAIPGIKTLIAIGFSAVVVVVFRLNIFGDVVTALQGETYAGMVPTFVSYAVTSLIVAGGSTTVYMLYTRVGLRPPSTGSGAALRGDGRLLVEVNRVSIAETEPVQVELDGDLIGRIEAGEVRFGGATGRVIGAGSYALRLTSNDKTGQPLDVTRNIGIEPGKTTDLSGETRITL